MAIMAKIMANDMETDNLFEICGPSDLQFFLKCMTPRFIDKILNRFFDI